MVISPFFTFGVMKGRTTCVDRVGYCATDAVRTSSFGRRRSGMTHSMSLQEDQKVPNFKYVRKALIDTSPMLDAEESCARAHLFIFEVNGGCDKDVNAKAT